MGEQPVIVTRTYQVSNVPILFGRTPAGERIPGGPYTLTQLIAGAGTFLLGYKTWEFGWWNTGSTLTNLLFILVLSVSMLFLAKKTALLGKDPILLAEGILRSTAPEKQGTWQGRAYGLGRPGRRRGVRLLVDHADRGDHVPQPRPEEQRAAVAADAAPDRPSADASTVQKLLAQVGPTT